MKTSFNMQNEWFSIRRTLGHLCACFPRWSLHTSTLPYSHITHCESAYPLGSYKMHSVHECIHLPQFSFLWNWVENNVESANTYAYSWTRQQQQIHTIDKRHQQPDGIITYSSAAICMGVFVYMRVYSASVCVSVHIHNRRIRRKHWEKPSSPRRNLCTHTVYFLSECYSSMEILRWVSLLPYNILKISTENRIKYQEIPTKSRLLLFCVEAKPQNHSEWHFKSSIIAINFNISLTYHKFKLQHECIS